MPPPILVVVRVIFALVVALIAIKLILPMAHPDGLGGACRGLLC